MNNLQSDTFELITAVILRFILLVRFAYADGLKDS